MSTPFTHTLRSLDRHPSWSFWLGWSLVLTLFAAWAYWFFAAQVAIHAVSVEARLESDRRPHRVAASVSGVITAVHGELGNDVEAGQLLVELEDVELKARLLEEKARRESALLSIEALEQQKGTERNRATQVKRSSGSATEEVRSRRLQAEAALRDAEAEVERLRPLVELGILGRAELERAEGVVSQLKPAAEAHARAVDRLRGEAGVDLAAAEVQLDALDAALVRERGTVAALDALIEGLEHNLAQFQLRSPVAGELGRWADLQPGDVIRSGEILGSVIPEGELRVVADFEPSVAVGRIREGQSASMALEGFPWSQFGKLRATVTTVGLEPGSGRIRVELEPHRDPDSAIPWQHGLPGTVEVEVEELSPASLVLRLAGRRVRSAEAAQNGVPGTEAGNR